MKLNYPRVNTNQNQKVFVSFFIQNKRYRLYNGNRIGSNTNPNSFPLEQRKSIANLLAAEVYNHLINGGVLESYRNNEIISGKLSDLLYQDLMINFPRKNFKINSRICFFDSEDFSSAMYALETDLPFSYNLETFHNQGLKYYVQFNYKLSNWTLQLRFAHWYFSELETISSGNNQINGNKMNEVKLSLRLKL